MKYRNPSSAYSGRPACCEAHSQLRLESGEVLDTTVQGGAEGLQCSQRLGHSSLSKRLIQGQMEGFPPAENFGGGRRSAVSDRTTDVAAR